MRNNAPGDMVEMTYHEETRTQTVKKGKKSEILSSVSSRLCGRSGAINRVSIVLLVLMMWDCGGQKELDQAAPIFVGTVQVIGNEPFTDLSIYSAERIVRIVKKDTTELFRSLWMLQGQKVRIHFRPVNPESDSTHVILERFELVKD